MFVLVVWVIVLWIKINQFLLVVHFAGSAFTLFLLDHHLLLLTPLPLLLLTISLLRTTLAPLSFSSFRIVLFWPLLTAGLDGDAVLAYISLLSWGRTIAIYFGGHPAHLRLLSCIFTTLFSSSFGSFFTFVSRFWRFGASLPPSRYHSFPILSSLRMCRLLN